MSAFNISSISSGASSSYPITATQTQTFTSSTTGGLGGWISGTFEPYKIPCQHVTSDDLAEYLDGKVFTYCEICKERIEITQLPGGVDLLRLKTLITFLKDGISDELVEEYVDIRCKLQDEISALEEAKSLITLVDEILRTHL